MSATMLRRVLLSLAPFEVVFVALMVAGVTVHTTARLVVLVLVTSTVVAEVGLWTATLLRCHHHGKSVKVSLKDATRHVIGDRLWGFIAAEIGVVTSLGRLMVRRPKIPPESIPITYHRQSAPIMWTMVGLVVVEIVVLHLVIPWPTVRLVVTVLSLYSLLWIVGFIAGFVVQPHLLSGKELVLRHGPTIQVAIPLGMIESIVIRERDVSGMRSVRLEGSEAGGDDPVLHIAQGGRTNVDLTMTAPLCGCDRVPAGEVRRIHFWVDDPRAFSRLMRSQAPR